MVCLTTYPLPNHRTSVIAWVTDSPQDKIKEYGKEGERHVHTQEWKVEHAVCVCGGKNKTASDIFWIVFLYGIWTGISFLKSVII